MSPIREMDSPRVEAEVIDGDVRIRFVVPYSKFGAVDVILAPNAARRLGDIIDTLLEGFDAPSPQASAPALATRKGV